MTHVDPTALIDPVELSQQWLHQEYAPTPQQAAVIGAPAGPTLVVAGAGAGKTETMAARVVWLVANGTRPAPEQVLGLTFTRKAARELGANGSGPAAAGARRRPGFVDTPPRADDPRHRGTAQRSPPPSSTYDAYAGDRSSASTASCCRWSPPGASSPTPNGG
jgi:DNA helicase-2/ATP-dependent DNA helicase PcrA